MEKSTHLASLLLFNKLDLYIFLLVNHLSLCILNTYFELGSVLTALYMLFNSHFIKWIVVVQLLSVRLFVTPWTAAHQASLSFTVTQSLLRLVSFWVDDAIQPSHHLSSPFTPALSFPASESVPRSRLFASSGQSIGASASVLPMNILWILISFRINWFDLCAIQDTLKSLLQYHSLKQQFFGLSFLYGSTLMSVHDYWKSHIFD